MAASGAQAIPQWLNHVIAVGASEQEGVAVCRILDIGQRKTGLRCAAKWAAGRSPLAAARAGRPVGPKARWLIHIKTHRNRPFRTEASRSRLRATACKPASRRRPSYEPPAR